MTITAEPVNRVLGDASFVLAHRRQPVTSDDDTLRIQTHLRHVIEVLEAADTSHLGLETQARRAHCLDLLDGYATRGRFPRNTFVSNRQPVFVDLEGTQCAVGFLIAETIGVEVTLDIASKHLLDYIEDIDDPRIDAWAEHYGFTRIELAMIQPGYITDPTTGSVGTLDFIFALGIVPLWTCLYCVAVKRDDTSRIDTYSLLTLLWGLGVLIGNIPGQASSSHLPPKMIIPGLIYGLWCTTAGAFGLSYARGKDAHIKAVYAHAIVLITTTIVLVASISPISNIEPCTNRSKATTYRTHYPVLSNIVAPSKPYTEADVKRVEKLCRWNPCPSYDQRTGSSLARECPRGGVQF